MRNVVAVLLFFCFCFWSLVVYSSKTIRLRISDCETQSPIPDVHVITKSSKLLGISNADGEVVVSQTNEEVIYKKLGYQAKKVVGLSSEVCLTKKTEELSEVSISTKRPNFYDTLRQLRNENKSRFINDETSFTYRFRYKSSRLDDHSMIDQAQGSVVIRYKKNYSYPNLFSNNDDNIRLIDFEYQYNPSYDTTDLKAIKYLNAATILCCYDPMEAKFDDNAWWNYRNAEDERSVAYFETEKGGRKFVIHKRGGGVNRYFYFDSINDLQKVEVFQPAFFYDGNYESKNCSFFLGIDYRAQQPKVAEKYVHSYEVRSSKIPYKVILEMELTAPQQQRLSVQQSQKQVLVFSLSDSFFNIYREIQKAKKRNQLYQGG